MPASHAINYSLTMQRIGVAVRCGRCRQGGSVAKPARLAMQAAWAGLARRAERAIPHRQATPYPTVPTSPLAP